LSDLTPRPRRIGTQRRRVNIEDRKET
jgi:hypothetical protein